MSDIETAAAAALRDAFRRHLVAVPTHRCWTDCSQDIYARLTSGSVGSVESLHKAFLAHLEVVPVWNWDTYSIESTDHRCDEACFTDIAARL